MNDCPSYYEGNGIACANAMESMVIGATTSNISIPPMALWWWLCAFKYLWRWPGKNGIEDLRKCNDCTQRLIEIMEAQEAERYDP